MKVSLELDFSCAQVCKLRRAGGRRCNARLRGSCGWYGPALPARAAPSTTLVVLMLQEIQGASLFQIAGLQLTHPFAPDITGLDFPRMSLGHQVL